MSGFLFDDASLPSNLWTLPSPAAPTPTNRVPIGGNVGLGDLELPVPAEALLVVAAPWVDPALHPPLPPLTVAPPAPPRAAEEPGETKPTEIHFGAAPQLPAVGLETVSLAAPSEGDGWAAPLDLRVAGDPPPAAPAPGEPARVALEPGEADGWSAGIDTRLDPTPPLPIPAPAPIAEPGETKPTTIHVDAAPEPPLPAVGLETVSLGAPSENDGWVAPLDLRVAGDEPHAPPAPPATSAPAEEPGETKPTELHLDTAPAAPPVAEIGLHTVGLAPSAGAGGWDTSAAPELAIAPGAGVEVLAPAEAGGEGSWTETTGPLIAHEPTPAAPVAPVDPEAAAKAEAEAAATADAKKAKDAEADALARTSLLLNAVRFGLDSTAVMLDALRGAKDVEVLRQIFEERTGHVLDEWIQGAVGGAEKLENKKLNQAEAAALLSGEPEEAITAAVQNCGARDKAKLGSILASLPRGADGKPDPELLELLRIDWKGAHDGALLEEVLSPAEALLLLEGRAGDAKGVTMAGARGTVTDTSAMIGLLQSAKDPGEREDMLRAYAEAHGKIVESPEDALAFFESDIANFKRGPTSDMLLALAQGDDDKAAAAGLMIAINNRDFEGMNAAMEANASPNEPGISPEEQKKRLAEHQVNQEALEAAWYEQYGDKESGVRPRQQFEEMLSNVDAWGENREMEQQRLAASRGEGGMPFELEIEYAVKTNDAARVKQLMSGLDHETINQLDAIAAERCDGKNLSTVIDGADGATRAALQLTRDFGDKPASNEAKIAKARAMCDGSRSALFSDVVAAGSGAAGRMDENLAKLDALEAKLAEGALSAEDQTQLDHLLVFLEGDVAGFKSDRDTMSTYAGRAASGAISVGAGLAAPALAPVLGSIAPAVLGSLAGTGAKMALGRGFKGSDYGVNKAKADLIKGLVGAAVSGGMATDAVKGAVDAVGEALPGDSPLAEAIVEGGLKGGVKKTAATSGDVLASKLTTEKNPSGAEKQQAVIDATVDGVITESLKLELHEILELAFAPEETS